MLYSTLLSLFSLAAIGTAAPAPHDKRSDTGKGCYGSGLYWSDVTNDLGAARRDACNYFAGTSEYDATYWRCFTIGGNRINWSVHNHGDGGAYLSYDQCISWFETDMSTCPNRGGWLDHTGAGRWWTFNSDPNAGPCTGDHMHDD